MGNVDLKSVSAQYMDVLKEIGNIGAGNATTALASMLQCRIDMAVPEVKLIEVDELAESLGGKERVMTAIFLEVEGDITGDIIFLLEQGSASFLVSKLMGMEVDSSNFTEMELSCIKEISNIIAGSYLNSLSTLTNLKIYPSIPHLQMDMVDKILHSPVRKQTSDEEQILFIQTEFTDDIQLGGYFVMIPDTESYGKILGALGISLLNRE